MVRELPRHQMLFVNLSTYVLWELVEYTRKALQRPRLAPRASERGKTLRPSQQTPLWNRLRADVRALMRRRGDQSDLARLLGLPRQRVNEFLTRGGQMPDAERTLVLLAWIAAVRQADANPDAALRRQVQRFGLLPARSSPRPRS